MKKVSLSKFYQIVSNFNSPGALNSQVSSSYRINRHCELLACGMFLCSKIAATLGVLSNSSLLEVQVGRSIEVRHKYAFKMFLKH